MAAKFEDHVGFTMDILDSSHYSIATVERQTESQCRCTYSQRADESVFKSQAAPLLDGAKSGPIISRVTNNACLQN